MSSAARLEQIKALYVRPDGLGWRVSEILIGPKARHMAKKLTGDYEASVEIGSLREAFPGNSVAWIHNGDDDDYPHDPGVSFWSLPQLDFLIWGPAIIFGMRGGDPSDHSVEMRKLTEQMGWFFASGTRKSALFST